MEDGGKGGRVERIAVLAVTCALVFVANYAQLQLSAMAGYILGDLGFSQVEFSAVLFAPYLPAVIFGIPLGRLGDKLGARRVVAACVLLTVAGCALRLVAVQFVAFLAASFLLGVAPAACNSNCIKIIGPRFGDRTERAMGWYYASSSAGIAASLATTALFPSAFSAFALPAAAFAVLGALWLVAVPTEQGGTVESSGDAGLAYVMSKPQIWVIAAILGVAIAATTAYSSYLVSAYEVTVGAEAAGVLAAWVTVGSIPGSLAGPWICDHMPSYRLFLVVTSVLGAAAMYGTCLLAENPSVLLLFATGVLTAAAGPVVQSLPRFVPGIGDEHAGSAGGIVSCMGFAITYAVAVVLPLVAGDDVNVLLAGTAVCLLLTLPLIALLPKGEQLSE